MISFFRRALSSWLVLGLLGLVMIAFIVTGVGGDMGGGTGGGSGDTIATVGRDKVASTTIEQRVETNLAAAREQNPAITIAAFVTEGGLEQTISEYIAAKAVEIWGLRQGLFASERLIDGQIAGISAFFGPTGKFDNDRMRAVLAREKITERQMRNDIGGDAIRRQILIPVAGATRAPDTIVMPYASSLLEERSGTIGVIPAAALPAGPAPTDAEIQAFYRTNIARFTIGERRALRYAIFGDALPGNFAATDAEIQAFYRANTATYASSETRSLSQVVLPDQAAANAFAAKVRAGTAFATAAQQVNFGAADIAIPTITKQALTSRASAAVANAAFGATQGAIVGPVRSDFGWHVIKVDVVHIVAAKPLEAVRAQIADAVTKQKRDEALAAKVAAVQDAIDNGSSFDDVVRSEKLTVVTTPPLLPSGAAPEQPDFRPAPEIALLLRGAQQLSAGDDPVVETIGSGSRYALLAVSQVVAAKPAPIAMVRQDVVAGLIAKRRSERAEKLAKDVLAKIKRGVPMAQALRETGVTLPAPQPTRVRQMDLARNDQPAPRPLALLFTMTLNETRLIPAEGNAGWYVVNLAGVKPGDAATMPSLVETTRGEFARYLGQEYAEQFNSAVAQDLGVTRNTSAIARLRAKLLGAGTQ